VAWFAKGNLFVAALADLCLGFSVHLRVVLTYGARAALLAITTQSGLVWRPTEPSHDLDSSSKLPLRGGREKVMAPVLRWRD
jgi:hypothetical protein